ncbi:hypothetical protein COCC4DRAFT_30949 [Bipolaris maydis ATCC 48331]|uniref:Uncharacterized protein n=2 Tax=Cochliobolus heterostrophus TaxID=5016 RepID=M2V2D8_COCH5|nr:uncharacterized protein COCC4DRAFT_30949 [Bipolaris maydis ATCC 48331]EMD94142.1 hypothetical protein COCHEDRAFT_1020221 [Bipolaris maydis C5]ENI07558.1 hypothetical protein COCC4DRAFT_30949 [Bipolaris maydis ATCC 48331]
MKPGLEKGEGLGGGDGLAAPLQGSRAGEQGSGGGGLLISSEASSGSRAPCV